MQPTTQTPLINLDFIDYDVDNFDPITGESLNLPVDESELEEVMMW